MSPGFLLSSRVACFLILGLSLGNAALAEEAQPLASAPPAATSPGRNTLIQAMQDYKAGKLDDALAKAKSAEAVAGADQAVEARALELQASILVKKKDAAGAENAYIRLVTALDQKQKYYVIGPFPDLEAALKRDVAAGDPPPEKTLAAYAKLGKVSYKLTKNRDLAVRCFRITLAHGYATDESEEALTALGAMPPEEAGPVRKKGLRLHALAGFWMFTQSLIHTADDGSTSLLDYATLGPCAGVGAEMTVAFLDVGLEACGMFATGNIKPELSTVTYAPAGVSTLALLITPQVYWRPGRSRFAVGLELPVLMEEIDAPTPAGGSGTKTVDLPSLAIAYGAGIRWNPGKLGVALKGAVSSDLASPMLAAQLTYAF